MSAETDRELLELAAKAAGYEFIYFPPYPDGAQGEYLRVRGMEKRWDPLNDDGDNRRLQVALRFGLIPMEGGGWDVIRYDSESCEEVFCASDSDDKKAVVRAAAEIGKAMK